MCHTGTVKGVDSVRVLVVDDDEGVGESVRQRLGLFGIHTDIEQIRVPENIENPRFTEQTFAMLILDVMFQEDQEDKKRVRYLLGHVKNLWPHAVVVILSNYTTLLSERDKRDADLVVSKLSFTTRADVLIKGVAGLARGPHEDRNAVLSLFGAKNEKHKAAQEIVELYRMTGYVVGQKGQHMEVAVREDDGLSPEPKLRNILMLASLFTEKGLEDEGTSFVYRVFSEGGRVIAEVYPNPDAEEQAVIPEVIDELLARLDEQDEQLRRKGANGE
jgi:hypothetical protein